MAKVEGEVKVEPQSTVENGQGTDAGSESSVKPPLSRRLRAQYKVDRKRRWYDSDFVGVLREHGIRLLGLLPFLFFESVSVFFFVTGSPFLTLPNTGAVLLPHGIACALLPLSLYPWLPQSYRKCWGLSAGLIMGFALTLPIFGPACIMIILRLLKKVGKSKAKRKSSPWVVGSRAPDAEELDFIKGGTAADSILQVMNGADPVARRNLVLATKRLAPAEAVPVLRTGLRDSDEEVKLYAQGILSKLVERYEGMVADLKKDFEANPEDTIIMLQLAEQYCEIVELDLVTDQQLQRFYLKCAIELLESILLREPGNDRVMILLAKYQLMINEPDKAMVTLKALRSLGVSKEVLVPVEVEALYLMRSWHDFRERLSSGIRDRFCDPQLQSLGEFWVPSTSSPGGGESAISRVGAL